MEAVSGDVAVEIVTTVFVLSTMFAMGLNLSVGRLLEALRDRQLLSKSLAVNLVAVPAVVYLLVRTISVGPAYATGIL
jgi:BASS family bile acid:Na+ symporter